MDLSVGSASPVLLRFAPSRLRAFRKSVHRRVQLGFEVGMGAIETGFIHTSRLFGMEAHFLPSNTSASPCIHR